MKKLYTLLGAATLLAAAPPAFAQASQPAGPTVNIKLTAKMPSLTDATRRDNFKVQLSDAEVISSIDLECQAGRKAAMFITVDRGCAWKGSGVVINPRSGQKVPRTTFRGDYTTAKDSSTDVSRMQIDYAPIGQLQPSTDRMRGELKLKPTMQQGVESATRDKFLAYLGANNKLSDDRTDVIQFNRVFVPSAGLVSDKGCTWNGEMVWTYQTEVWLVDLTASCDTQSTGVKEYKLKGNMPWTEATGQDGKEQLDLNLALPSEGAGTVSDDAMFASGDDAMFGSSAPGIQGTILLTLGPMVKTMVDGQEDTIAGSYEGQGSFTGTQVPLSVVRSFSTLMTINMSGLLGG